MNFVITTIATSCEYLCESMGDHMRDAADKGARGSPQTAANAAERKLIHYMYILIHHIYIYIGGWGAETTREIVSFRSCVRAQLYTRSEWISKVIHIPFPCSPFAPRFLPFPL